MGLHGLHVYFCPNTCDIYGVLFHVLYDCKPMKKAAIKIQKYKNASKHFPKHLGWYIVSNIIERAKKRTENL